MSFARAITWHDMQRWPCASTVYRARALERSYSLNRQRPLRFRITAN
jgi:hypothetical protein